MKSMQIAIGKDGQPVLPKGHANLAQINATIEQNIAQHQKIDAAEALMDAAKFARRVRTCIGMTQSEFSQRIDIFVVFTNVGVSHCWRCHRDVGKLRQ